MAIALLVAACAGATPVATIAPTPQPTPLPTSPPEGLNVSGQDASGVSLPFRLAGGAYAVEWVATADIPSCALFIFLATKANGPTIKDLGTSILPTAGHQYTGTVQWTGVAPGTYVLQEDWSGALSCRGPWSATITAH